MRDLSNYLFAFGIVQNRGPEWSFKLGHSIVVMNRHKEIILLQI